MNPFSLALSLIRVPKLFVSLLLGPFLLGLMLVLGQLVLTSAYLNLSNETSENFETHLKKRKEKNWLRESMFSTSDPLPSLKVCRWIVEGKKEMPPSTPDCALELFDVAIQTDTPKTFVATEYIKTLDGSTRRLHICKHCRADVTIRQTNGETVSDVIGLNALGVFGLAHAFNDDIGRNIVATMKSSEHFEELQGTVYVHLDGVGHPINATTTEKKMIFVTNVGMFAVIILWLALKAHRKVLDYFSRNGALLPLVAACGKNNFYFALWTITVLRVSLFLLASVPASFFIASRALSQDTISVFPVDNGFAFFLWLVGLIVSLGALTVVASIAELKHRDAWVYWLYKYVPIAACLLGTGIWTLTIFVGGSVSAFTQQTISSIPIIGISPLILAPIIHIDVSVLLLHILLSSALLVLALWLNAKWFASHLEQL